MDRWRGLAVPDQLPVRARRSLGAPKSEGAVIYSWNAVMGVAEPKGSAL